MSWELFKNNILARANNPDSIKDIDTVAKLYASEYDAAIKRGGDTSNRIPLKTGNLEAMEQFFKAALQRGLSSTQPYDLVGEMGKGVLAYWGTAILNPTIIPITPAIGATINTGVISNKVTVPGTWAPPQPSIGGAPTQPEPTVEELLKTIPDDNNTVEGAKAVIAETGTEILTDGGEGEDFYGQQLQSVKQASNTDNPKFSQNKVESLDSSEPNDKNTKQILCGSGVNYDAKISPSFRLRDLSISCVFPHKIKAQVGLTENDIVCNLQNVAINILEPLKAQYPTMRINSAFRGTPSAGGKSQHMKGEAIDVQFTGFKPKDYLGVADWIKKNLPFDQMIFEHGNSIWIHLSCKRNGSQRKQLLTMYKSDYEPGIQLYYS